MKILLFGICFVLIALVIPIKEHFGVGWAVLYLVIDVLAMCICGSLEEGKQ